MTLVEYADFECPYCGQAEPVVRELVQSYGADLRYVFRHLPLVDVHEHAEMAAEAAEVAGESGKFWEMHDRLFDGSDALRPRRPHPVRERDRAGPGPVRPGSRRPPLRTAGGARRRGRRHERRGRDADVLRERPPSSRRVRHRRAAGRYRPGGPGPDRVLGSSFRVAPVSGTSCPLRPTLCGHERRAADRDHRCRDRWGRPRIDAVRREIAEIRAALLEWKVIFFRDQHRPRPRARTSRSAGASASSRCIPLTPTTRTSPRSSCSRPRGSCGRPTSGTAT